MKIELKQLSLTNFKGCEAASFEFGNTTTITGRNGSGKSTIYDAFLWLLFGKDQLDRKNHDITPIKNGVRVDNVITTVTGILLIDDKPTTLTRSYVQKWTRKRGATTEVFSGYQTEYIVDGLPRKESEYNAFVNSIAPEGLLKILTNVNTFLSLNWKEQRRWLFEMVGTITPDHVSKVNPMLLDVCEYLKEESIEDITKRLQANKRKHDKEAKESIIKIDMLKQVQNRRYSFERIGIDAALNDTINKAVNAVCDAHIESMENWRESSIKHITNIEHTEYQLQQYLKVVADESSKHINELFTLVDFQLSETNIDGTEIECCVARCKKTGVPIISSNTAAQINAGLDIIGIFAKHYSVTAPVFIDRMESVNKIEKMPKQSILLEVTKSDLHININN